MLKILLKEISKNLSFYYFKRIKYNKQKHIKISNFLKKKNKYFIQKKSEIIYPHKTFKCHL